MYFAQNRKTLISIYLDSFFVKPFVWDYQPLWNSLLFPRNIPQILVWIFVKNDILLSLWINKMRNWWKCSKWLIILNLSGVFVDGLKIISLSQFAHFFLAKIILWFIHHFIQSSFVFTIWLNKYLEFNGTVKEWLFFLW